MTSKGYDFSIGGPARVWETLQRRSTASRAGLNTGDLLQLSDLYADIGSFYEVVMCKTIPQEVTRDAFPDHYLAWQWFISNYPASPKWQLEALILADLPLKIIVKETHGKISPLVIDVYRRAFFNIEKEQKESPGWMHQHVWSPGMSSSSNLYFYDFIYKIAALYGGSRILRAISEPKTLGKDTRKWIADIVDDCRARYMLNVGNMYAKLDDMNKVIVTESIQKEWAALREATGPSNNVTDVSMDLLIKAVGQTAQLLDKNANRPNRQTFLSAKYDDSEIKLNNGGAPNE